jgi:hypothetical protein
MGWIFEVRAQCGERVHSFGARRDRAQAQELLDSSRARVEAAGGRNEGYWIEAIDTTGLFAVPTRPTPRERYTNRVSQTSRPGAWHTVHVEILDGQRVVAEYDRNYSMLSTFEPFRQGDRNYALISPDYTGTSVMDLDTGRIVASETADSPGFCPVGFYVPDWWDVHDGSKLPGQVTWSADDEWPSRGDFGFVWGCIWGDDSSWKVQLLDLSRICDGELRREERFGYIKLATRTAVPAEEFIRLRSLEGHREVQFVVEQTYNLDDGARSDSDPWG